MSATTLPRLLSCKELAEELGVAEHTAASIMRDLPKIKVGRRVFVSSEAVADYLRRAARS